MWSRVERSRNATKNHQLGDTGNGKGPGYAHGLPPDISSSGRSSYSMGHMDCCHEKEDQETNTTRRRRPRTTNGGKLIIVTDASFMSWTEDDTGGCPRDYCPTRRRTDSRGRSSPLDVIGNSQSYDDISRRTDRRRSRTSIEKRGVLSGQSLVTVVDRHGADRTAIEDPNQLNSIGVYLPYNVASDSLWRYHHGPEQNKSSNIQCLRERPLTHESGRMARGEEARKEWNRVDPLVGCLFTSLVGTMWTKSIVQLTRTSLVLWIMCRVQQEYPVSPLCHSWRLPTNRATTSSPDCSPGNPIEFTLTKRQEQQRSQRRRACNRRTLSICFWSLVIAILFQGVFIVANLLVPLLAFVIITITASTKVLGFSPNYHHCAVARNVNTCGTKAAEGEVIPLTGQYHQRQQQQQQHEQQVGQEVPVNAIGKRPSQQMRKLFFFFRQRRRKQLFGTSATLLRQLKGPAGDRQLSVGRNCGIPARNAVEGIVPGIISARLTMKARLPQSPWQRRRRKVQLEGLVAQWQQPVIKEAEAQEVIVAKKTEMRKLLEVPVGWDFHSTALLDGGHQKASPVQGTGPVKTSSGQIVDKTDLSPGSRSRDRRASRRQQSLANVIIELRCRSDRWTQCKWTLRGTVSGDDSVTSTTAAWMGIMDKREGGGSPAYVPGSYPHASRRHRGCSGLTERCTECCCLYNKSDRILSTGVLPGQTVAIESPAYRELNDVASGYNNYCNYKEITSTRSRRDEKQIHCDGGVAGAEAVGGGHQRTILNNRNQCSSLSARVGGGADIDYEQLSKALLLSSVFYMIHQMVTLLRIIVVLCLSRSHRESRRIKSRPVKDTSGKSGCAVGGGGGERGVGVSKLSVLGTIQQSTATPGSTTATVTIRVITHYQNGEEWAEQQKSEARSRRHEAEAAPFAELSERDQKQHSAGVSGPGLRWAFSAISPLPVQTGTWSLEAYPDMEWTSLMFLVVVVVDGSLDYLSSAFGAEDEKEEEVEKKQDGESTSDCRAQWMEEEDGWLRQRRRGAALNGETQPSRSPETRRNVNVSRDDRQIIKLKPNRDFGEEMEEDVGGGGGCKANSSGTASRLPAVVGEQHEQSSVHEQLLCPRAVAVSKRQRHLVLLLAVVIIFVVNLPSVSCLTASSSSSSMPGSAGTFKYSTNVVRTRYGPLRGIVLRSHPVVEAYLGVPYATPPVGSLRYMPPMTPSSWKTIRLADRYAPVCPQRLPMPSDGDAALLEVPRERLAQLRRFRPLLTNQSEDCLFLNLYVPRTEEPAPRDAAAGGGSGGANEPDHSENPLKAAIVYVHGESFEWNSGNLYDGTMLAAHGDVIVVTINFRLGILGFLKTGTKDSAQGNFGLMDLVAGLHWLRENLPAFNGDGNKITVMGHGTGAALANILAVSPVASDLITRVILLSGSALSPWAIQKEPLIIKRRVAEQTGCHGDLLVDDIAPCLRNKSVKELLAVSVDSPRFLPGFAPFIDGTVIVNPINIGPIPLTLPLGSSIVSTSGIEFANYPSKEILFGLTALESYLDLNAQDLEFGFNETRRDRILRTFVRNVFHFHLNEIYSMLKNEYTDWERPARSPIGSRDATMELLSDGHTAAPLIRMAYLHSVRGGRSYFLHFRHQTTERDFPQRFGSVRGEDVPFCLGLPASPLYPHNYTKQDYKISIILVRYLSNFAKSGNPNGHSFASGSLSSLAGSAADPEMAGSGVAFTDIQSRGQNQHQQLQRRSIATGGDQQPARGVVGSARKYLINSEGGSGLNTNGSRLKFKAPRRRRKRQPSGGGSGARGGGGGGNNSRGGGGIHDADRLAEGAAGRAPNKYHQRTTEEDGVAPGRREDKLHHPVAADGGNNNNKHRNIYSSADNDKEAFLRNYELNINSAALRRMNSYKDPEQQRQPPPTWRNNKEAKPSSATVSSPSSSGMAAGDEEELMMMLNDDDNAGVLNAVAAVQNGGAATDMVEKNRAGGEDNWLDADDHDEYYPSRDHFSDLQNLHMPFWDSYDSINQLYLEIGAKTEIKNHYRGHKLSMWLNLIPQLHTSGDPELPMRHHHFQEESAQFYDGTVRSQPQTRPPVQEITIIQPPTTMMPQNARPQKTAPAPNLQTTDCPINLTAMMPTAAPDHNQTVPVVDGTLTGDAAANKKATNVLGYSHHNGSSSSSPGGPGVPGPGIPPQTNPGGHNNDNASTFNLLRRLANSQFQNYNTALTVTIVVGCFLLLLNVLIFVGIYYQREKRVKEARRKDELFELDCQQYAGSSAGGVGGNGNPSGGPLPPGDSLQISGRSPSQGSEKNGHKSGAGDPSVMTTLSRKGSFQSVRNFGNFNEYRCYDEKNFQQQQQQHYGSRHHLHHHHSHGSLNRKYLVDVCHNPGAPTTNGSVTDLQQSHHHRHLDGSAVLYGGDYTPSALMNRELSASSSHIATQHSNGGVHQQQQQLHHHHHTCQQSRRHSMVTEGTQSDPISLKDLEYETVVAQQQQQKLLKKKLLMGKGKNNSRGGGGGGVRDLSECRVGDKSTGGTQTDNVVGVAEDEDPDCEDEEEEDEEEGDEDEEEEEDDESPGIPDPPPPPRGILTVGGILRTASSSTTTANNPSLGVDSPPTSGGSSSVGGGGVAAANASHPGNLSSTPSATKKRVQIQEISV